MEAIAVAQRLTVKSTHYRSGFSIVNGESTYG
jgi:hypothetical protein